MSHLQKDDDRTPVTGLVDMDQSTQIPFVEKGPRPGEGTPVESEDVTTEGSFLPGIDDDDDWDDKDDEYTDKNEDDDDTMDCDEDYEICDIDDDDDDDDDWYDEEIDEDIVPTFPSVEATIKTLVTLSPGLDVVTIIPFPGIKTVKDKTIKRKPHMSKWRRTQPQHHCRENIVLFFFSIPNRTDSSSHIFSVSF